MVRNCRVVGSQQAGSLLYDCLTDLAVSGAPLITVVDGTPTVIGIGSGLEDGGEPIERRLIAASASQFEQTIIGRAGQ